MTCHGGAFKFYALLYGDCGSSAGPTQFKTGEPHETIQLDIYCQDEAPMSNPQRNFGELPPG